MVLHPSVDAVFHFKSLPSIKTWLHWKAVSQNSHSLLCLVSPGVELQGLNISPFANMCLTSMSLQGAITWFVEMTVDVKHIVKYIVKHIAKWKHDSSLGDSLSILDSPKWFDPKKVPIAKTLWHHCYLSFKCPCGIDNNNSDQPVYKKSNEKQRIIGEDW